MILGFELTILVYVMLAALFRLVWGFSAGAAFAILVSADATLLFLANPLLAFYLLAQVIWIRLLYALCQRWPERANTIAWFAFAGLVPINLRLWTSGLPAYNLPDALQSPHLAQVLWFTGSSFFVLKSFVGLKEALQERRIRWWPMLAGLTFLPAFPAGPIFGTHPFRTENIAPRISVRALGEAIMHLGWGAAAFYIIAPKLRELIQGDTGAFSGQIMKIYVKLAALYFDFAGYSLMAIALGAFFGVTLPKNFNRPYLARSIREFWQRWHMSLSWFVSTYLFKPFVRRTGSAQTGIFLAFAVVGLWHEIMPGYLLWGLGHGLALSLAMKPPALWNWAMAAVPGWLGTSVSWFLTMTWVALLSHFANVSWVNP